ncbi:MAG: ligase-associated DNA damage response DEXH box helicase [Rhodospirillales bacterium]|nr:ligase-associated DNA damage response DEXH box helicase [Rhodospirillales bacterium]
MYSGMSMELPARFESWLSGRDWRLYPHQQAMVEAAQRGAHVLLIAPTGGGKTLAGFLPSLLDLAESTGAGGGLHTLYISPLKALTVDIHRNLERPIEEMGLAIRAETRTGDTPQAKRRRQRSLPPHLLMTTPESLALLLSYADAGRIFAGLRCVIIDELHALVGSKRGDLLALGLARLQALAPRCRRVGLSATVAHPGALRAWLSPLAAGDDVVAIQADDGPAADVSILTAANRIPWSGHMATHALPLIHRHIRQAATTIVFVNTRAQAEFVFQQLWRLNEDNLAIALHHGSLAVEQRRKVEAAMAGGRLRAVVATSSLDLGVDWAAVDLVIQVGAPKGVSRLVQRIGRAGHRLDRTSRAILVPANRFEHLECTAALEAVRAGELDGDVPAAGGLEVLAQHLLGCACSAPFAAEAAFAEVRRAAPYARLTRRDFDDTLRFVECGGYALGGYERYRRLTCDSDGLYRVASPRVARLYRMNIGTIVEAVTMKVQLRRGRVLGEVEESFIQGLQPGDTFVFSGDVLRFEAIRETSAIVSRAAGADAKVPAYAGGRLPLSTSLARRVRAMLADPGRWGKLPEDVQAWLRLQQARSLVPDPAELLVEIFPRGGKAFLIVYSFEGRNVHQTLGMLLTRRMERIGLAPLGFVATDYVLAVWSVRPAGCEDVATLLEEDMLGDDLEAWMSESSVMKRTFRNVAVIAGLIERRHPGHEKSRRQVTVNSDLIYNVLRRYEPDHVLLRATRDDAARGLADLKRLAEMLRRIRGRIVVRKLRRVSPLAVPVLLEIGKESVFGAGVDELLDTAARELIAEATDDRETDGGAGDAEPEARATRRKRCRT